MNDVLINYLVGGDRFLNIKTDNGSYRIDRLIIAGSVLLMLVFFVSIFLVYGADRQYHIHYLCNTSSGLNGTYDQPYCVNPFYMSFPLCSQVWPGACYDLHVRNGFEYGKPAPWIVSNFGLIIGLILFLAFLLNHFVHNNSKSEVSK